MTRQELLKMFEHAADDAMRGEIYGTIEVTFKAGVPEMLQHSHRRDADQLFVLLNHL